MQKILGFILITMLLVACGGKDEGKSAKDFLPNLGNDYQKVDADNLSQGLQIVGFTTTPMNPLLTAKILLIDRFISCSNKVGSVAFQIYINQETPEEAGAVFVINENRLTSFETLKQCAFGGDNEQEIAENPEIKPCSNGWKYKEEDVNYYFAYVGTTNSICEKFKDKLPD